MQGVFHGPDFLTVFQTFRFLTALSGVDAMHFTMAFTRLASLLILLLAKQAGYGGFPKLGVPTIMETQMEKNMENEMESRFI